MRKRASVGRAEVVGRTLQLKPMTWGKTYPGHWAWQLLSGPAWKTD